jgi:phytoene desaturase
MYMVGAGAQPGAGTPSVMMSAKMTAREIAKDYQIPKEIVNGVPSRIERELEAAD